MKFDISNFVFMTIILFNIEERRACQDQRFCNCNSFESDSLYEQKNSCGCDTSKGLFFIWW